jgi:NAD(P)-dependent dehydrogenase (short-subunit alcohol dehydrogenase family)
MSSTLAGQVVVVTGASRGIGRAIAVRLGALGAHVVVNYLARESDAADTVQAVAAAGAPSSRAVRADVGVVGEARHLIDDVLAREGRVDVLVHNAGIQRSGLVHKTSDEEWHRVVDVNLNAAFYLARAVLPSMLDAGRGQIVNVASASAFIGQRGAAAYVASKHGLIGLTRALAAETVRKGIRVNAVAPGLTETDLVRDLTDAQREVLLATVPMQRVASPEEIAEMVAFVITGATYSTGNVFHASGGVVMA